MASPLNIQYAEKLSDCPGQGNGCPPANSLQICGLETPRFDKITTTKSMNVDFPLRSFASADHRIIEVVSALQTRLMIIRPESSQAKRQRSDLYRALYFGQEDASHLDNCILLPQGKFKAYPAVFT
ncbi:hypothetical protein RRG08_035214 [Elysia crispata]|uniref:Uncharacterized protein n=1 Tax=Elysia crispata TaxID=231223 RepID=A0AAE0ZN10_9GAST|nr:hypothetical protein RRG08_035214 [Elysia crispata]